MNDKPNPLGWLLPIVLFVSMMVGTSAKMPIVLDEYFFYRMASQFPDYSSTTDWFYRDRPELLPIASDFDMSWYEKNIRLQYENPIFVHFPLPVILVYPAVKAVNSLADAGIIPHIEDGYTKGKAETITFILRLIPIGLFAISMWLIFKLLWKKVGNHAYLFALVPAASSIMLTGAFLFYWDVFMMFFFVLTLYLMEKNSKWQYVTAILLVNTKILVGMVFLIPLIIKNRKIAFAALSAIPFYIATLVVTGDPLYLVTHYMAQKGVHDYMYTIWLNNGLWGYIWNLGILFFAVLTLPIIIYFRKYPVYVTFWLVATFYAYGSGLGLTHLSTVVYIGALSFPFVAHELKVIPRIQKWLSPKEVEI